MNVAIIGASGIGKYHAKWFHKEGCEISGFVGRTPESIKDTQVMLERDLGLRVNGYKSLTEIFLSQKPDVVVISTPYETHKEYIFDALDYGAHVFCEKPLIWNKKIPINEILEDGKEILEIANIKNKFLGMNAQYVSAIRPYLKFRKEISNDELKTVKSFYFEMEANPNKWRKEFEDLWIDMASHPLSMLLSILPGGNLDRNSIECIISKDENRAKFIYRSANKDPCNVEIVCRNSLGNKTPIRRFGINDFIVNYVSTKENGQFNSYLTHGDKKIKCPDFMHKSVSQFVKAVRTGNKTEMLVSGQQGYDNLILQAEIYSKSKRV